MHNFGRELGSDVETQQSFDFLACGGLNDGARPRCGPRVPNKEQEVAPQQLDVRVNDEPMGLDQAIAVPALQAILPLTAPVERTPDNGTIT